MVESENLIETKAYFGGHLMIVEGHYTPEQQESWGRNGGDPCIESEFEITRIVLGERNVTALFAEECEELYEKIAEQVKARIEKGEL